MDKVPMDASSPPLEGVFVLDLSRILAGPYASMCLGDMGAEVVKVENPDGGDDTRRFGPPFVGGEAVYYLAVNRNKRSIAIDLKHPDGKALLWKLVDRADVLLENFRPGTLDKLGFPWDALHARNPRLILASISAFGLHGHPDWSPRPGYDLILQGMGGIPSLTGEPNGPPYKVGASIADVVAGLHAVQGILLALLARHRTGLGQRVDTSLLDGQVSLLTYLAGSVLNAGLVPPRTGNRHLSIAPYGSFPARDGWLNVAVANDSLWRRFCRALGATGLAEDPRFTTNPSRVENVEALEEELAPLLSQKSVEDWMTLLDEAGIPAGPILPLDGVLTHPQILARDMVVSMAHARLGEIKMTGIPVRLEGTPGQVRLPPPALGEHTSAVLAELGIDSTQERELRQAGVVA